MKVKNIVFFGFAAAMLSGVANADPLQVASTAYVTSQLSTKADASTTYSKTEVNGLLDDKQDVIDDLSDIRSGAAKGATALQQADLAGYATTSDMNTALEGKADASTTYSKTEVNGLLADKADADIIGSGFDTTNTVAAALAGKQATISDLSDIRSGAAAGATAVQPGTLTTTLAGYATTSDLNTALGDYTTTADLNTALADKANANIIGSGFDTTNTVAAALAGKQATISDLSDIRSGAVAGATAVQPGTLTTTLGDYATTSDMNTALADKANASTTYSKTEVNGLLADKANANIIGSGFDTTNTVAAALATKADDSDLSALDNRVDAVEDTIGTGIMSVNGANQATIVAAINALDTKTNGLATDQNMTDLQNNVTALSTTMGNTSLATTAQTVTGAVNELKNALADVLPAANTCTSSNNHCVLSIDKTTGALTWIDVTTPFVE